MTTMTTEPASLRAGDTWRWRREDLADYPAPTWTLKYRFKHPTAAGFEIIAGQDGTAHEVNVAAAATAGYYTGAATAFFTWVGWVESGAEVHTVDSGTLKVLPNLRSSTASATADTRSHARKVLEALEALIEGKATSDVAQYTINGRSLTKLDPAELIKWRNVYARAVADEEAVASYSGEVGGRVQVRLIR